MNSYLWNTGETKLKNSTMFQGLWNLKLLESSLSSNIINPTKKAKASALTVHVIQAAFPHLSNTWMLICVNWIPQTASPLLKVDCHLWMLWVSLSIVLAIHEFWLKHKNNNCSNIRTIIVEFCLNMSFQHERSRELIRNNAQLHAADHRSLSLTSKI